METARKCAICGYELAALERCPECGVPAPLPPNTHEGPGYWPNIKALHPTGGAVEYQIVRRGALSVLVAPPFPSWKYNLLAIGGFALFALFGAGAYYFGSGLFMKCFGVAFALMPIVVAAVGYGMQLLKSRDVPVLTIDHAGATIAFPYRDPIPLSSIRSVEYVTFGTGHTGDATYGFRRIVFEFTDGKWYELIVTPSNTAQAAKQIAQCVGAPFRTRDLGLVTALPRV